MAGAVDALYSYSTLSDPVGADRLFYRSDLTACEAPVSVKQLQHKYLPELLDAGTGFSKLSQHCQNNMIRWLILDSREVKRNIISRKVSRISRRFSQSNCLYIRIACPKTNFDNKLKINLRDSAIHLPRSFVENNTQRCQIRWVLTGCYIEAT